MNTNSSSGTRSPSDRFIRSVIESEAKIGLPRGFIVTASRIRRLALACTALNLCLLPIAAPPLVSAEVPISSPAPAPFPAIFFDQTVHDFGKIPYEQIAVYRFKVSNRGGAALHLIEVKSSCGCTSTLVGKASLPPGESTEIEINFKPENSSGLIHKSLVVTSDDPIHSVATLHFKADVLPPLPSDRRTISFREVDRTAQRFDRIRLSAPKGQSLNVSEIFLGDATHLSVFTRRDGEATILEIVLDGTKLPTGAMRGENVLTVTTTGDSIAHIPILVSWEARRPLETAQTSSEAAAE